MAALLLLLPIAANAATTNGDAAIKVTLSQANGAQSCDVVANDTQVYFDGRHAGFKPEHLQLLLNGVRVPASQAHYAWPRVTLKGGLSPGRNTVELLAETADGAEIDRSIVVKVGDSVHSADGVSLDCQPVLATVAPPAGPPMTTVVETSPTVVYEALPPAYYGYPALPYYGGYYGYPQSYYYGNYYGFGGPVITLGFRGCIGCYRHGYGHRWRGGGYHHWRH